MKIVDIKIPKRTRKEMGDIAGLAASIQEVGLLHPPVVNGANELIAGERRIKAVLTLGWDEIPVRIIRNLDEAVFVLKAERDENVCRENFRPSEAVALGERLEKLQRKPGRPNNGGNFPPLKDKGKTRDKVGDALGMSGKTYEKAKAVVEAVKTDSKLAGVVQEMDSTGNVTKAFNSIAKHKRRKLLKSCKWPSGKYRVIYADPPWKYNDSRTGTVESGAATAHYEDLDTDSICKKSVADICLNDCVLFLWVTSPLLPDGLRVINSWGFVYKASFVWDKIQGYNGHYNDVHHELLLVAVKGSCTPEIDSLPKSILQEKKTKHSRKPESFRKLIDSLYPSGPRLELFARTKNPGWDSWGNELD